MHELVTAGRFAVRRALREPVFTLVAVLILALAIGANLAVFSAVNGVLLRPLPYEESQRLVMVWNHETRQNLPRFEVSPADYVDLATRQDLFAEIGASLPYRSVNLTGEGDPERLNAALLTHEVVPMLGLAPRVGRAFTAEEDTPGNDQVVLLSTSLWQRRFNGDPEIAGRTIQLDGKQYTVVGVMPPEFDFPRRGLDAWLPMGLTEEDKALRSLHLLYVVARLAPGVGLEQAASELDSMAARLAEQYPESNSAFRFNLVPLREEKVGELRAVLLLLQGTVLFILLIACANLANLLLSQAVARQREMSIRGALGARPAQLVRQLLVEGLLLSTLGGALGLLLAWIGIRAFPRLIPADLPPTLELGQVPPPEQLRLDATVVLAAVGAVLLTTLLFALVPVVHGIRRSLTAALREGGRGASRRSGGGLRGALVVLQVSVALLLLVGAGLMIQSVANLSGIESGVRTDRLLTLTVSLPWSSYQGDERRIGFFEEAMQRIERLPTVEQVSATSVLPLIGHLAGSTLSIEGRPLRAEELPTVAYRVTTPGYFRTMGIPLEAGRDFTSRDREGSPEVAIVNQAAARQFWPGEEALGQRIKLGPNPENIPWLTVVGVVADVHDLGLDEEPVPVFYQPFLQDVWGTMNLVVRTSGDPVQALPEVRRQIWSVDPELPIYDVRTGEQLLSLAVLKQRFVLTLMALFAAVALVLAAAGIYSVISHSVSQRTHEIGVRMALGADRRSTLGMVVRQGMKLIGAGLVIGLVAALALTRLMQGLLFEVAPTDAVTLVVVLLVLTAVALAACLLPARRATRIDPAVALRVD